MKKNTLGSKIKQLRKKHGEKQEFLRKHILGLKSKGSVSSVEKGKFRFTQDNISKLEEHWNLPPGFLMDPRKFTNEDILLMQRFVNIIANKDISKHLKSIEELINSDAAGDPDLLTPPPKITPRNKK